MDRRKLIGMWAERIYPYAFGVLAFILVMVARETGEKAVSGLGMGSPEIVSANFDVMVTFTAFLFSVFVLAIAPGGGFIEKIFNTPAFKGFKRYVVEALVLGSLSAIMSLPYMATKQGGIWLLHFPDAILIAVTTAAFLAFFRVVKIFIQWMGYDAKHRESKRARS